MATSTLEKPKNTVKFDSLDHLKIELNKYTPDKLRLAELEKTIDEALKEWERKGIIEFTEDEWKWFITKDKLPPIEELKSLLKKKITGMELAKEASREKREGLLGELQTKAEETKEIVWKKVQDVKEFAGKKLDDLNEKAEALKKYSKPGLWALSIGLTLKMWWYKAMNWISGLFGKKGKYDKEVEKLTMEKEFLEDPEAALKKYGAEAKEWLQDTAREKVTETKNALLEKVPALAGISATAVGLFAMVKKFLPNSLTKNIDEKDGSSILNALWKYRTLKFMGKAGLSIGIASTLFLFFSKNPAQAQELGEMPNDAAWKKSWWERACMLAGVGIDKIEGLIGLDSAENVQEIPDENHCYLQDHPMIQEPLRHLKDLGDKLVLAYKKNPEVFQAAGAWLSAVLGIVGTIRYGAKGTAMVKDLLWKLATFPKNHPIVTALTVVLGVSSVAMRHYIVSRDISKEDIKDLIHGALDDESIFGEMLEPLGGREKILSSIEVTSDYLVDNAAKSVNWLEDTAKNWMEKVSSTVREAFVQDNHEKIQSRNKQFLEAFQEDFIRWIGKEMSGIETMFGQDKQGGVVGDILKKIENDQKMTESDVHTLMSATRGTRIRIFPEGWSREQGRTIQFVIVDEEGMAMSPPKNICMNPALSETSQAQMSQEVFYDPMSMNALETGTSKEYMYLRWFVSDLTEAVTDGNDGKQKTIMDRVLWAGGVVWSFGSRAFMSLWSAMIEIPKDTLFGWDMDVHTQAWLINVGWAILPVVSFGLVAHAVPPIRWVTITPIRWWFSWVMKIARHTLHDWHTTKKLLDQQKKASKMQSRAEKSFKTKTSLTVADIEAKKAEIIDRQNKELDKLVKKHGSNAAVDPKFEKLAARNKATLEELEKVAQNLIAKEKWLKLPHEKINLKVLHDVKVRGRGIMAIAGMIGLWYAIDKSIEALKWPDSGSYRDKSAQEVLDESAPDEDGIDYFGYDLEEASDDTSLEKSNTHCENITQFETKEKQMEQEYLEDFNDLYQKLQTKAATIEDINKVCEAHGKRVEFMKKLLGENKWFLQEFWNKKFPQDGYVDNILPEELKERQNIKAFMAIFRRGGKFELEYMNQQDLKNILTKMKDDSEKFMGQDYIEWGMTLIPVYGNFIYGKDAIKDFKNGDTKSALWNLGWCVGWLILDITTAGTVGAVARAAKLAAHTGVALTGQSIQKYFDDARSETISIEQLS
jgi:hypothetical protein